MITEVRSGWLIHRRQEHATQWLTVLSREQGVCCLRKPRGRKPQHLLQPFTPLWCLVDVRAYGEYVRQIETESATLSLIGRNLMAGLYVNELIYRALPLHQPEPDVFVAYGHTLRALVSCTSQDALELERILRHFEWILLAASGWLVSFTHDYSSGLAIDDTACYRLVLGSGFIRASDGFLGAHVLAIARGQWESAEVLNTAKHIMRRLIQQVLGDACLHSRVLYRRALMGNG